MRSGVDHFEETIADGRLTVKLYGKPNALARLVAAKPRNAVSKTAIFNSTVWSCAAVFDTNTVNEPKI